jgi:hypothetical protein
MSAGRLELTEEHFVSADRAELAAAGWAIADAVRDVAERHVSDAGRWPCNGSIPDELARLKQVAQQLEVVAQYVRRVVAPVERNARVKAWREDEAVRSYRKAVCQLGDGGAAR